MQRFITNIKINHLYHLQDFDIPCGQEESPHLLITGKNGSGKTVLLDAIASFLDRIKDDKNIEFTNYRKNLTFWESQLSTASDEQKRLQAQNKIDFYNRRIKELCGQVELTFDNVANLVEEYQEGNFIITLYEADRSKSKAHIVEPESPTKPQYQMKGNVRQTVTSQFLNFLADLKIQEALARNERQMDDADKIHQWFDSFERLLQQIYQDKDLRLEFNYRDYSFRINTGGIALSLRKLPMVLPLCSILWLT